MCDIGRSRCPSRRAVFWGAMSFAVIGFGGGGYAADTKDLNDRFDHLSKNGNSNCTPEFLNSIATMPAVARLQGSCCSPMNRERYINQIGGLAKYAEIKEIPSDPYDIPAGIAQKVMPYYDLALNADEERAYQFQSFLLFVIFLIVFPWMMSTMISYTHSLLSSFQPYVR